MSRAQLKGDPFEIKRRTNVSKGTLSATPMSTDAINPQLEFNDKSQLYVVVNLANKNLRPKSFYPAFRVLGLFPKYEDALQYARQVSPQIPECNTYILESCRWNLIPQSSDTTPEQCYAKVEALLTQHCKNIVLSKLEFDYRRNRNSEKKIMDENVFDNPAYNVAVQELQRRNITLEMLQPEFEQRLQSDQTLLVEKITQAKLAEQGGESKTGSRSTGDIADRKIEDITQEAEVQAVQADQTQAQQPPNGPVDMNFPIINSELQFENTAENQNFVLVSIIGIHEPEPAFCVYAGLKSLQECEGYDFNVLRTTVPEHDITHAVMGAWLFPHTIRELEAQGLATYRLDEQNRIMEWNRSQKNVSYGDQEGLTIEADMVLDEKGNIVPLNPQ